MVYRQSLLYGLRFIVITKNQLAAAGIAYIFYLGCVKFYMIRCSASDAGTASAHTVNDIFIRYFYIDCVVNFLSACFQGFRQCYNPANGEWEHTLLRPVWKYGLQQDRRSARPERVLPCP